MRSEGPRRGGAARARQRAASLASSQLLRNAAFLYASTIATSLLGFVFWLIAARLLTPAEVGGGSAAQSAAQLVATIGILGLGTLSIAELSVDASKVRQLVSATCIVAGAASTAAAVVTGLVLSHVSHRLAPVLGGGLSLTVFSLLAGVTAAGLVADDACIGLLRGEMQLARNVVFAGAKLLLLPLAVSAWDLGHGRQIVVVWLASAALSLVVVFRLIGRMPDQGGWRPDFANLIAKRGLIWSHHLLNVAVVAPSLLAPVVIAAVVSPTANAGFYTAMLVTNFVNIIPSQLSTALFAITPGDEVALARETRNSLQVCVLLAVASAMLFLFGSHEILHLFRRSYESAAHAMTLLGFCTFPTAVKSHYVAIMRVHGRMRRGAAFATLAASIEILGIVGGAIVDQVTGAAAGLLAALVLDCVFFGPTVLDVLRGSRQEVSG